MEFYDSLEMNQENVAEPEDIVVKLMAEREKLIMGHYGDPKSIHKKLDESLLPAHYAISLSGEPTMYPKLPQLIRYLKTLPATKSIFLVTNGQEPQMLRRLQTEDALPTQIYLSTNAADRDSFMTINKPRYSDSWERWNESLELLQKLDTRTVLRMTMIRNHNDSESMIPAFAEMINRANVHFIEIKSYMHIGRSTNRLNRSDMLEFEEIGQFAGQLAKKSQMYSIIDDSPISRIVLLQKPAKTNQSVYFCIHTYQLANFSNALYLCDKVFLSEISAYVLVFPSGMNIGSYPQPPLAIFFAILPGVIPWKRIGFVFLSQYEIVA